ncbi:MAG TPA: 50S ribosomal protein L25 [Ktedonobacteraceae bacterium]|jgi:large subunit ribosomal protein L25|nr:50S ribosomal protein L25 [Ktedonobacteraceae bacterium]
MAQRLELEVQKREVLGKATKHLRKAGLLPANVSGHKEASVALQIDAVTFDRLRRQHGTRGVLTLKLPGGTEDVLVRQVQHDPITGAIMHVDFARVGLGDRVTVKVPLHFVGEAPGVKIEGGVFLHLVDILEVECRASDIVEALDVDISPLKEINAVLHAKDVKLPRNFSLVIDPEEPIAKIDPPRVQEAAPATTESTASAAPEASATES